MFFAFAFTLLAVAAFLAAEAATLPARQRQKSVRRASTYGRVKLNRHAQDLPFNERVVEPTKKRLAGWEPLEPRYTTGVFAKYAQLVSNASEGAVTS